MPTHLRTLQHQGSGTATDIEHAEPVGAPSAPVTHHRQHPPIAGHKQQGVDDVAIVMMGPALEMFLGAIFPDMLLGGTDALDLSNN